MARGNQSLLLLALDYERKFDYRIGQLWMLEHWHYAFYFIIAYILLVFKGQELMTHRPAFELRNTLVWWNLFLASFSTVATIRTVPEFLHIIRVFGLRQSVCPDGNADDTELGFWIWMFAWSRVVELGDTVFIVLRKQKLIFLHWYHHIVVLFYCWYSYRYQPYTAMMRWFMAMNYSIHAVMYGYYALRALRVKIPRGVAMVITGLQLTQMVVGSAVNLTVMLFQLSGESCSVSRDNVWLALFMYFTFFVLFGKLFVDSYLKKQGAQTPKNVVQSGRRITNHGSECDKLQLGISKTDSDLDCELKDGMAKMESKIGRRKKVR